MISRYAVRVLAATVAHPVEAADRIRQRSEMRRLGDDREIDYVADDHWDLQLHRQLGLPGACPDAGDFDELMAELERSLPDFPHGHDADPSFAKAVWCVARHTGAMRVVETGVARGITSRFVLEAIAERSGHLWSIDLPPLLEGFHGTVGAAVPHERRAGWTYVRGASQRKLRPLLERLAPIDLFIQDSVGTRSVVSRELDLGWRALRPSGWLVAGGINRSEGFRDFLERNAPSWHVVAPSGPKKRLGRPTEQVVGQFAVALKGDS